MESFFKENGFYSVLIKQLDVNLFDVDKICFKIAVKKLRRKRNGFFEFKFTVYWIYWILDLLFSFVYI